MLKDFNIEQISEGKNSVLFQNQENTVFYEKLSNTIHAGSYNELKNLQRKVERIEYNPRFESGTLKKKSYEKLEDLVLNVTESCNMACSYCIYSGNYKNERVENNSNMDFKTAKKAVDLFVSQAKNPSLISFYGGEPLNNMELINNIVDYVKKEYPKRKSIFSMTSNFINADKYLDSLIDNDIHVTISLDGPQKIHDKNRKTKNGNPTYKKIIENLDKFEKTSSNYVKNNLSFISTYADPEDLNEIVDFFIKNKDFYLNGINKIESKGLKKKPKEDKILDIFSFSKSYINSIFSERDPRVLKNFFDQPLKKILFRDKKSMPLTLPLNGCCYPGNRRLFTNTDGTFYTCERFGEKAPIGNVDQGIDKYSINELINKFTDIRNNLCTNNCWAQRICTPCIQASKDPEGDISKEGLSQNCTSYKSQLLVALAQYSLLSQDKEKLKNYANSL